MNELSAFLKEVDEQPEALKQMIGFYADKGRPKLNQWAMEAKNRGRVVFSGMGTSEFAPEMILADLAQNGIEAMTVDAGEWLHYPRPINGLPVLISQSGESVETRKLAEHLQKSYLGLTNDESSFIGQQAALTLLMRAGGETAISTKTYVNTLGVLFLMAKAIKGEKDIEEGLTALTTASNRMNKCDIENIAVAALALAKANCIQFVSRGPAMVAAKQAALTFMEGTRIPSMPLTGGAFRHGPFELAGPGHHVIFLIPCGPGAKLLEAMACETAALGSNVVVICDHHVIMPPSVNVLQVPELESGLFPLATAKTQALLLHEVARLRGVEAGIFRYGSKITAKE